MKKIILISALLFSFNSWADGYKYEGDNYKECERLSGSYAWTRAEYLESMKVCELLEGAEFTYDGTDYDECMKEAGDASNQNADTYSENINVCRDMDYQKMEERRRLHVKQERIRQEEYQRQERIRQEEYQRERELRLEEERRAEKERIVAELRKRCVSYGFTGDNNIAACVQREAQHDLELAQQERALKLAQQRIDNQSRQAQVQTQAQTPVVEEEVPWWLEFLADVAIGVAEGYKQNAIHNSQHKNEKKDIFRDCRPNC